MKIKKIEEGSVWANIDFSALEMRTVAIMNERAKAGNPPVKPVDTGRMSFAKPPMYYGTTFNSRYPKD